MEKNSYPLLDRGVRLLESQTYDFDWWMVIQGKRTCPLTRDVNFLECPLISCFTAFVSFPFSRIGLAISAVFLTCLCRSQNGFVFLLWSIVSEMKLEKFRTILHIRGQNCLLVIRLHTQFHYIYNIPNTCLPLRNHSEIRSQISWELITPSS